MKLFTRCFLLFLFQHLFFYAKSQESQDTVKQNPVIFIEGFIGHSEGSSGGLTAGVNLNYQIRKNLFSFRHVSTTKLRTYIISPFFPFPLIENVSDLKEYSLLYGQRIINNGTSYSFSLGLSYNNLKQLKEDNDIKYEEHTHYLGVPFEINFKVFKKEKSKYRVLAFIPVGNPTSYGRSIGLKALGNISNHSYAGISLSYGFGMHKKY